MKCRLVIAVGDSMPIVLPMNLGLERILRPEIMDVIAANIRDVQGEVESAVMIKLTKVQEHEGHILRTDRKTSR